MSFGSLGDLHPTSKVDDLTPISHKKFNEFIKSRGLEGTNNYPLKRPKSYVQS